MLCCFLNSVGETPRCPFVNFPKKERLGNSSFSDISFIDMLEYFRYLTMAFIV